MTNQDSSKTRTGLIIGAIVAFVLIAGVVAVLASGSGDSDDVASDPSDGATTATAQGLSETQPVTVTGDDLLAMPETGSDPALGMTMPEISGSSFDGSSVEIRNDGKPKILIFLAHW